MSSPPRFVVRLRDEASADLAEAAEWYEERRPGLGTEFLRAVRARLAALGRDPLLYPPIHGEVRRVRVRRFPYLAYFLVVGEQVIVFAVLHGRRDPHVWQTRPDAGRR